MQKIPWGLSLIWLKFWEGGNVENNCYKSIKIRPKKYNIKYYSLVLVSRISLEIETNYSLFNAVAPCNRMYFCREKAYLYLSPDTKTRATFICVFNKLDVTSTFTKSGFPTIFIYFCSYEKIKHGQKKMALLGPSVMMHWECVEFFSMNSSLQGRSTGALYLVVIQGVPEQLQAPHILKHPVFPYLQPLWLHSSVRYF